MNAPVLPGSAVVTRPRGRAVLVADHDLLRRPGNTIPQGPDHERLHQIVEQRCDLTPDRLAVDATESGTGPDDGPATLTFAELDVRANRLVHHLRRRGSRAGDRIALLLDRPVEAYVAALAVSKLHATYVPLDVGFPPERIAYILDDADVATVLTRSTVADLVAGTAAEVVRVDDEAHLVAACAGDRPEAPAVGDRDTELAYVVYTSGSTGRPKGVAVEHRGVTAFLRVASTVYGLGPDDRVYQGMTIAFDFSTEELWVPWAAGATVVPKPPGETLLGADLTAFLQRNRVSALCCVPTLLATLEADELEQLRFLLVSGEACPADLVARWHRPERRFLNVYGPTEATVTATWTELHPDRSVTIGVPLPGYAVVVLDPEDPSRVLPRGETGEIGIAGVGLARGYVNLDERTHEQFVPDLLDIDDVVTNPSGRVYRTGDLGRIDARGEIEYHGRIDLQVKIRGYRIELTEIESVLLQVPEVAAAVVDTHETGPGSVELVGYYTERPGAHDARDVPAAILERLRADLPPYMVPAYLERLDAIPLTTNDKADRARLPAPSGRRAGARGEHVDASGPTEERLADALGEVLGSDRPSVTADLFADLGVTSLLVARYTAALRESDDVSLAVRDVYQAPTVRALAARVGGALDAPDAPDATVTAPVAVPSGTPGGTPPPRPVAHALFGSAQALVLGAGVVGVGLLVWLVYTWSTSAVSFADLLLRGAVVTLAVFVGACVLPVAVKWTLVGRWTARTFPLWGLAHLRLWAVRTVTRLSPLALFPGTPLLLLHLRALGARIGRDVVVLSGRFPVAADLITIGDGTVVRAETSYSGYRALPGRIELGPVTLGADVFVGERCLLDVDTRMADGAQLGHASSLPAGATVPAGGSWHGTPAEAGGADHRTVPGGRTGTAGTARRVGFSAAVLLPGLVLATAALTALLWVATRLSGWLTALGAATWVAVLIAFGAALALGVALLVARLVVAALVPRVLGPLVRPGRLHPLHGVAHLAQLYSTAASNAPFAVRLLGDSSFVVGYLRALGYRLRPVVQTGSNFGTQLTQDAPAETRVGAGTMVSDGLRVANADYSATAFRVDSVVIGERIFLGNDVVYPAGARVGDNCLLATKVAVPLDGPVHHDVGLLGSPPFTIPRSRPRDPDTEESTDPTTRRRRLRAKDRHNALSVATVLAARALLLGTGLVILAVATALEPRLGPWTFPAGLLAGLVVTTAAGVLFERAATGFRRLRPAHCSIYHRTFWRHERLWKFYGRAVLPGTPLQGLLLRLAGVRTGRRVLDDGCVIPEKSLVTLGDDVVLNEGSVIQGHSLEDGVFTRDATEVAAGSVLGVNAFVHYGVTAGEGTTIDADAFLMKGERTAPGSTWAGNPAGPRREVSS